MHHGQAVDPLQGEYDGGRQKPLPEGWVVVVDTMQDEEEVHQYRPGPVDYVKWNEPEQLAEMGDAWDCYGYYGNQDNDPSDGRKEVGLDAGCEMGEGGHGGIPVVKSKGGEMS